MCRCTEIALLQNWHWRPAVKFEMFRAIEVLWNLSHIPVHLLILRKHFPIFRNFSIVSGNIPQRTHKAFLHLLTPTEPSHTNCWLVRSKLVRIHWGLRFEHLFHRLFCVFNILEVKKGPENFAALSESFVQGVLFCSVVIAISSIILSLMHSERGAATKRVKLYVNPE